MAEHEDVTCDEVDTVHDGNHEERMMTDAEELLGHDASSGGDEEEMQYDGSHDDEDENGY